MCGLSHSPVVPPSLSAHKCGTTQWVRQLLPCMPWSAGHHPVLQPLTCHVSSPTQLLVSAPPTSVNECFFFNSLVVRLPYSLIFCQFWLFFVFSNCPFGCVRRYSVSTYASILAGSSKNSYNLAVPLLNIHCFMFSPSGAFTSCRNIPGSGQPRCAVVLVFMNLPF